MTVSGTGSRTGGRYGRRDGEIPWFCALHGGFIIHICIKFNKYISSVYLYFSVQTT